MEAVSEIFKLIEEILINFTGSDVAGFCESFDKSLVLEELVIGSVCADKYR